MDLRTLENWEIPVNGTMVEVASVRDSAGQLLWERPLLPSIYQCVEYIGAASANGAYIDLGSDIKHQTNSDTIIWYRYKGKNTDLHIFGTTRADSTTYNRYMLSAEYTNTAGYSYYSALNATGSYTTNILYPVVNYSVNDIVRHKFIVHSGESPKVTDLNTGDSVTRSGYTVANYTTTANIYLLGHNYGGKYRGNGQKEVCYFRFEDNGAVACELVPCYRKADGVIGVYDIKRRKFLTNAGTGTFYKGADITFDINYYRGY